MVSCMPKAMEAVLMVVLILDGSSSSSLCSLSSPLVLFKAARCTTSATRDGLRRGYLRSYREQSLVSLTKRGCRVDVASREVRNLTLLSSRFTDRDLPGRFRRPEYTTMNLMTTVSSTLPTRRKPPDEGLLHREFDTEPKSPSSPG